MRDKSNNLTDAFKHFVQTFSAIIGGGIAIRLAYGVNKATEYEKAFAALIILSGLVFIIIVVENFRSWRGYREKLSAIAGQDSQGQSLIPLPAPRAEVIPVIYVFVIIFAVGGALFWNPLG